MAKSVFHDLFPSEEAAELEMRAKLPSGINNWLSRRRYERRGLLVEPRAVTFREAVG